MATSTLAEAGHNLPPPDADPLLERLTEDHADLLARADELLQAEARMPGPLTDETIGPVTDFARQIKACAKSIGDAHKAAKAPFLESGRTVDGWKNSVVEPLRALAQRIERRISTHLRAKEVAERRAREAIAKRLAAEAKELKDAGDAQHAKEVRAEARDLRDETRMASPADLVRTHTGMGGVATLKASWMFDIQSLPKVDLEALRPYLGNAAIYSAIRGYVRAGGRELAGVKIYQERKALVR